MTERIVLCPSPARDYEKRRWNKWPQLADAIVEKYGAVEFVGTEEQSEYVWSIINQIHGGHAAKNRCGMFPNVLDFMRYLSEARLIVSVNTFTMHAALAMDVPCVAIIGGTPASIVVPKAQWRNGRFLFVEDPALANWNPDTAEYGTPRINEITVEQVMEQVNDLCNNPSA